MGMSFLAEFLSQKLVQRALKREGDRKVVGF